MAKITNLALALALSLSASTPALAQSIRCHLTYGGETQAIDAAPVDSPYNVAAVPIGTYFLFRIVFQTEPADLASIKLYTYANGHHGPVIIHQANYPYPQINAAPQGDVIRGAVYGFSGLVFVYEPLRDSELQYWCEQK